MKKRFTVILITAVMVMAALLSSCGTVRQNVSWDSSGDFWRAGFAKHEIARPENETLYIAGYNQGFEQTGMLDPQYCRAVCLEAGEGRLVLVSVDCIGLFSDTVNEIVSRAKERAECAGAEIHVMSTHTHAGVDTLGLWGPIAIDGKSDAFLENVISAAADAAADACSQLQSGKLFFSKSSVKGFQQDSREPIVYDENIYSIRFAPDDGGAGFRIVNYAAHAESLRSENTLISADYPAYLSKYIYENGGGESIFFTGAVGGLINTKRLRDEYGKEYPVEQNVVLTGELIGEAVLSATEETELPASVSIRSKATRIPVDNNVFVAYGYLGILEKTMRMSGLNTIDTEVSLTLLVLGGKKIVLVPGELFPELAYGLPDGEEFYPVSPKIENPKSFADIIGQDFLVFGLADDEIGYIVPPNDWLLSEDSPFFEEPVDKMGREHYEETNSLGIGTAAALVAMLEELEASL